MILCQCRGVSDRAVRLAVVNGARSIDAVAARCSGAGSDCGSCRHAIQDLVDDAIAEECAAPVACLSDGATGASSPSEL